jgi:Putative transposase
VLHTWDQTLLDHFHLHCLVPAGALSHDQKRWTLPQTVQFNPRLILTFLIN